MLRRSVQLHAQMGVLLLIISNPHHICSLCTEWKCEIEIDSVENIAMEVKKILWPTDLSGRAKHALDYVKSLTEKYDAEIHVLYVILDIAHHRGLYGNFKQDHIDRIYAWEYEKASERIDQICSQELEGCPLYVKHIAVGDPAQEIIKTALKEKVDLVVLATRGAGGYFQVGAVAEKIVKYSPVPVMMVPTNGEPVEMQVAS